MTYQIAFILGILLAGALMVTWLLIKVDHVDDAIDDIEQSFLKNGNK